MDSFGSDTRFKMVKVPSHSHPQTSLESSSLYTTRINSQRSITPLQEFPAFDERSNGSMNPAWVEAHAIFRPTSYANDSIMPPDHTSAHNFSSFWQNNASSQSQNALPDLDQPSNRQRPAQFLTGKRAPKAPTMSAKDWNPHKDRIRQLYVSKGKSIEELREIMNREFGITAT